MLVFAEYIFYHISKLLTSSNLVQAFTLLKSLIFLIVLFFILQVPLPYRSVDIVITR
jgi:hypothetical protein